MKCGNCGAEYVQGLTACVCCGEPVVQPTETKKELPVAVRVLLVILSVILSICMVFSMLATALILDYRQLTSQTTIEKTVGQLFSAPTEIRRTLPSPAAAGVMPENIEEMSPNILTDLILDSLQSSYGDQIAATQEQVQSFLEKSSVDEFVSEKVTSYVGDFLNGTDDTAITGEELAQLIRDNAAIMESELGIEMTPEMVDQLASYIKGLELDAFIRAEVFEKVEQFSLISGGAGQTDYTVADLMETLRAVTSGTALVICIAINVLLIALLLLANRLWIPGTLIGTGIPMLIVGVVLSVPTALLQLLPSMGDGGVLFNVIGALGNAIAPVHYTMLILGLVLIITGAVTKRVLKKK